MLLLRRNLAHRARAARHLGGRLPIAKRFIDKLATVVVVPRLVGLGLLLDVVHALVKARAVPRRRARVVVDVVVASQVVLPSLPSRGEGPVLVRVRREPSGRTLAQVGGELGMMMDELRLGWDGLGLLCRYDALRPLGKVRSRKRERAVPTAHRAHRAHWAIRVPGYAWAWAVVHGVRALGHGADWGCTSCRGGGGGDVDCAEAVL